jgi:hypothetical protein
MVEYTLLTRTKADGRGEVYLLDVRTGEETNGRIGRKREMETLTPEAQSAKTRERAGQIGEQDDAMRSDTL